MPYWSSRSVQDFDYLAHMYVQVGLYVRNAILILWYLCTHILRRLVPSSVHFWDFVLGCLYAIGGCDDKQLLCSVEKLSNSGNNEISWSYVRPLPISIKNHAAVACKNKVCEGHKNVITCSSGNKIKGSTAFFHHLPVQFSRSLLLNILMNCFTVCTVYDIWFILAYYVHV